MILARVRELICAVLIRGSADFGFLAFGPVCVCFRVVDLVRDRAVDLVRIEFCCLFGGVLFLLLVCIGLALILFVSCICFGLLVLLV